MGETLSSFPPIKKRMKKEGKDTFCKMMETAFKNSH